MANVCVSGTGRLNNFCWEKYKNSRDFFNVANPEFLDPDSKIKCKNKHNQTQFNYKFESHFKFLKHM